MADIRDGERLPDIRGKEAYRQPDGRIALWDGERHVMIGPNREGLRFALQQMKAAREYENSPLTYAEMLARIGGEPDREKPSPHKLPAAASLNKVAQAIRVAARNLNDEGLFQLRDDTNPACSEWMASIVITTLREEIGRGLADREGG